MASRWSTVGLRSCTMNLEPKLLKVKRILSVGFTWTKESRDLLGCYVRRQMIQQDSMITNTFRRIGQSSSSSSSSQEPLKSVVQMSCIGRSNEAIRDRPCKIDFGMAIQREPNNASIPRPSELLPLLPRSNSSSHFVPIIL